MSICHSRGSILAFCCNWAAHRCLMALSRKGGSIPREITPLSVMCSGRIDCAMVLGAFERGAEGVMVIGCRDDDCRYGVGPARLAPRLTTIRGLMALLGLEDERFERLALDADQSDRLQERLGAFARRIERLGPSPFADGDRGASIGDHSAEARPS